MRAAEEAEKENQIKEALDKAAADAAAAIHSAPDAEEIGGVVASDIENISDQELLAASTVSTSNVRAVEAYKGELFLPPGLLWTQLYSNLMV